MRIVSTLMLIVAAALPALAQTTVSLDVDCWSNGGCEIASARYPGTLTTDYATGLADYAVGWSSSCQFADPLPPDAKLRRVKVDVYAIVDTIATGFPYCGASGTWNENLGISVNGEALPTVLTEGAFMCYSESPLAGTAKVYTSLSADFVTGFPGYLHGGSNTITISIAGITPPDGMSCPGYGINPNGGGIVLEAARITFTYELGHLFADVDGNFSAAAPLDDLQQYVPGSTLAGASLLPSAMPQQIKLHLLTPKGAAGKATFSVVASSSNPGLATNHPVSSPSAAPDIYFDTGSMKDVNLNKSTGDTAVTLFVNDYAAYGKIRVVAKSGSTIIADVTRAIPLDRNGNNIGDNGWNAAGVTVADSAETPGADRDSSPPLDLAIPSYASSFGDNLTRFEEYRGFMTRGVHTRTDPNMKDLFLQIDAFGGDTQFVDAMPVRVHAVAASEISNKEVNFNWTGLPGALEPTPDGHHWQNAVVVLNAGSHLDYFGSQSCGGSLPTDPCVPNTSSDVYIYADSIDARALQDGVSAVQALAARRATVAHEVGHAVNLYHNDGLQCVMYGYGFTAQGAWSNIPEMFCTGVNVTIFGCYACDPNTASMTVSNFDEVDTLVIKPPL